MKLTAKSSEVFDYVKSNGGHVSIDEICNAIGRASRSVGANVTDLQKKGLVIYSNNLVGGISSYLFMKEPK